MIDPQLLAQIKQLEIKTKRVINAPFMGNYTSVFKGQGMQFSEIRPYHIGDDVRRIDWNITAKRQSPYVKVFDEERELTAIIMLDISGSQSFGSQAQSKRALASEIAALLGFSANQHNDNVGLCLFTDQIERFVPAQKGRNHMLAILGDIMSFQPDHSGTDINQALSYVLSVQRRAATIFLISDFQDPGYEANLRIAAKRHDVVPIVITDPLETALPRVGIVQFKDPETGDRIWINTNRLDVRHRYKNIMASRSNQRDRLFKSAGLTPMMISPGISPVVALKTYFNRRLARQ